MTEDRSGDAAGPGASQPHAAPQSRSEPRLPALEKLLAAAARPVPVAPDAEAKALAAFRAARDEGALERPTRPMDDWRPVRARTRAPWTRAGLGTLVAGVMFGGMATATGGIPVVADKSPPPEQPAPAPSASSSAPDGPSAGTTTPPTGPVEHRATDPLTARPPEAGDRAVDCRAYEAAGKNEGKGKDKAMDSAVRERLTAAAGGPDAVEAYCAPLLTGRPPAPPDGGHAPKPGRNPDVPPADAGKGGRDKGGRDNGRFLPHQ